jgi:hypothetical protein
VEGDLARHAVAVEAHDPPPGGSRARVEVHQLLEPVEIGKEQGEGAGGEGDHQQELVLLGLVDAEGMDRLERRQLAPFPCAKGREAPRKGATRGPGQPAQQLLLEQRREQDLPAAEVDEALLVRAQQAVEEGGAAARIAHDEDRLLDAHLP